MDLDTPSEASMKSVHGCKSAHAKPLPNPNLSVGLAPAKRKNNEEEINDRNNRAMLIQRT